MKLTQTLIRPAALLALTALPAFSQIQSAPTVVNMGIQAEIDDLGDCQVELTLKMSAQEWAGWKSQYGSNPSLFKRDISKLFTQFEISDFQLEQDDMNRQAVVTIQGKGMSEYKGDGIFEMELESNMTGGDVIDEEYRVTYTEAQGPTSLTLVDQRMQMPKSAKDIQVTTNSHGDPVVRYEMPATGDGLPWTKIGLVLLLAGGGLMFFGRDQGPSMTLQKPESAE